MARKKRRSGGTRALMSENAREAKLTRILVLRVRNHLWTRGRIYRAMARTLRSVAAKYRLSGGATIGRFIGVAKGATDVQSYLAR